MYSSSSCGLGTLQLSDHDLRKLPGISADRSPNLNQNCLAAICADMLSVQDSRRSMIELLKTQGYSLCSDVCAVHPLKEMKVFLTVSFIYICRSEVGKSLSDKNQSIKIENLLTN